MINPLTLLTSPLEKGLAAAVAALLLTSVSEGLVIKYEMNSKTQCVSAVTATNAGTKTVTTAIRNVDNATNQSIQSTVSSRIASDLASLHDSESSPSGSVVSSVPAGTPGAPETAGQANLLPTELKLVIPESDAESCVIAYDVAVGWQEWYTQTQANWNNVENLNGANKSASSRSGASQSTPMANLLLSVPGPVWSGVSLGKEDVGQEQSLRDQGDGGSTRD